ncbi:hypothetical protein ILUMI_09989 [Ignelater luminosus]|uniref:4-nitrophenylphosphatase n=1 Tax=Ignelater luminosus TaxID=2038154 RepID=A0A8K0D2V8_IGNLU|nr:hypothetical protein ILUMI_09989 [Ignelater luminosus]
MKDLASLSSVEFKQFFDSFDNVLCDCDGVIFPVHKPITGAKESILKLKRYGKRLGFVTNNNFDGLKKLMERFDQYGYDAKLEDIVHPTEAMIDYLKSINFNKEIYLLSPSIMKDEFKKANFKLADIPDKIEENPEGTLAEILKYKPDIGAVILDIDLNLDFVRLSEAAVHLKRPDVIFMIGGTDKNIPITSDLFFMGPGYFQQLLIDFTGRKPLGFGKPGLQLNDYVVKKFNITNPSRTLFVGDSLEQDIGFATRCGYQKLLVLTGATSMDHMLKIDNEEWVPDFYVNSFGDLQQLIKD